MISRFESFLDQNFPNWKSLSDDILNQILDDFVGSIHLRIRHRRCTIYGVPQISRNPKYKPSIQNLYQIFKSYSNYSKFAKADASIQNLIQVAKFTSSIQKCESHHQD
ncbi:hypothetical protein CRE_30519 [Caenorhabditis remanei]|uniref:Uncharacterized protein n=1 Tax=Caenorhabditis remanei TaxID=31234 RepID=E3NJC5_CAERE|nr:hypothetical protein CRE_30519 [Caenorhabditis remanei]